WVDDVLLSGDPSHACLVLDRPVTRAALRLLVNDRQAALASAGVRTGGAVAICLPPSLAFVTNLLATWRLGAQAILLDHRLTAYEVQEALRRLTPQVLVHANVTGGPLRGFADVDERLTTYPGGPAGTAHALVQAGPPGNV